MFSAKCKLDMHCLSSGVLNELKKSEDMDFHFVRLHWFSSFTSEATKVCDCRILESVVQGFQPRKN